MPFAPARGHWGNDRGMGDTPCLRDAPMTYFVIHSVMIYDILCYDIPCDIL